ncbi:dTDP-4-dehydrorhamnose 3,5-epimerase [Cellulomonas shaoxiangyii]|uniref:dTDP-4-dehydrorhamnose 3,5-epimerase n=1 Tax=Cellulomonas shaoxiangyii TaxID=2566013 RepID=A0A4P7SR55_9CELL|nr:dTDP-4-dehydrorhamnose 3,5-epimerase [Cellulomonas shaoxiangyii]QCB95223.1 dTDP-4-dehydrorhamnose 3,5-epimerase [Cellulomonas shaoxiangyii]TGY84814.1 dTDP-4-dehydrorhamnose 3,5-epimerase [Cellulomonas shaoxiangyii]
MRPCAVEGAWVVEPDVHEDDRGSFVEAFSYARVEEATGRPFDVRQVNSSVSRPGVLRGIHFAQMPPSQAKYVTCTSGSVFDVVVDLRVGSPTFGAWDGVVLDASSRRSILVSEGLGHGFLALDEGATVVYLCTAPYAPGREHGIDPFDPAIAIAWPSVRGVARPLLSDKDRDAPSLAEVRAAGLLPTAAEVQGFLESLVGAPLS